MYNESTKRTGLRMRVVVQRVSRAKCTVEGNITGQIQKGYLLLVGFTHDDTPDIIEKMADKIRYLRINDDENGKMNLSIEDVKGDILSISQFTLYASCRKGRRPGFDESAPGSVAEPMYHAFNEALRHVGLHVEEGIFGADMAIDFVNDGPITIILDSKELF